MAGSFDINNPGGESLEKAPKAIDSEWYVVESGGDGAQAVLVCGLDAVRVELKRQMWAGDDEPSDDIKADIALLDDPESWTTYYPNYEPFTFKLDHEDGYIRVQRLTSINAR